MDTLYPLLPEHWLGWITIIVTICAALATVLPVPAQSSTAVYRGVYAVIQWIAFNLGKARNAQDSQQTNGTSRGKS